MASEGIAVLGAGTMGAGIAHVAAAGGLETTLYDVSEPMLRRALGVIEANLRKGAEKGKIAASDVEETLRRIRVSTELSPAVSNAVLVIEAIPEDLELKRLLFGELDRHAPAEAVLATNTSGLSITEIAHATSRPDRVIGMHFFNPVHLMRLIEIICGEKTGDEAVRVVQEVSHRMGKETVLVRESPGFVTSRMNALIGNEAFRMLEEGVASASDIDRAIKLGLNHPMGPFEMVDLVGLDVRLKILQNLHRTLGERFRPSPILEKLVAEGRLGRKVGKGVYEYPA